MKVITQHQNSSVTERKEHGVKATILVLMVAQTPTSFADGFLSRMFMIRPRTFVKVRSSFFTPFLLDAETISLVGLVSCLLDDSPVSMDIYFSMSTKGSSLLHLIAQSAVINQQQHLRGCVNTSLRL